LPDGARYPDAATISLIDSKYDNVLPSATLAWNVTDSAIVRAGLSRTMTRPNPGAMRAGISVPNADASSASLGNPSLAPYISDNIDLGFEYYTGGEGYLSFAAIRKELTGFTITRQTQVPFGTLARYGLVFESLSPGEQANQPSRTVPPGGCIVVRRVRKNPPPFFWMAERSAGMRKHPGVEILAAVNAHPGEMPQLFVSREAGVRMAQRFEPVEHRVEVARLHHGIEAACETPHG
jgi:hypothetical protein